MPVHLRRLVASLPAVHTASAASNSQASASAAGALGATSQARTGTSMGMAAVQSSLHANGDIS